MPIEQRDSRQDKLAITEKILGRSLPFNQEAERAILSSLLLNDQMIDTVVEQLQAHDFYYPAYKVIYQAMLTINHSRRRIDLITLQDELEKVGQLEAIGGLVALIALQEELPSLGLLDQYTAIVKEKAILRDLISSAATIITNCYNQKDKEIEAVVDEAEKIIFQISTKRTTQSFIQLHIWLKKTFEHLSTLKGHSKGITGISSGYKKLDEMTSGFQNGDFIVLAARPSMGKTALALSLAYRAAQQGCTVGFFSLEMSAEQLTLRLLSMLSELPHQAIRNGTISFESWIQLTQVAGEIADMKLFIDDTAFQSAMDIRAKARKLKAEHNMNLLIIDYLQLLHSHRRHENRHQEVSEISRSLKALAKELSIPILALSQLSRAVDNRTEKRPLLSDLRESGAIEQDADLIMFLYRDIVYNPHTEHPLDAELIIGKHRNGPTGTVHLNFIRELTRFDDAE